MKRIEISCSENDMQNLLSIFEDNCPFSTAPECCGEDAVCSLCIKDNIEFNITE